MGASSTMPAPEGPGSVAGAPDLPAGFTDTFHPSYIDTGELRLHAVIGGEGPPLLLVHGSPEKWRLTEVATLADVGSVLSLIAVLRFVACTVALRWWTELGGSSPPQSAWLRAFSRKPAC